MNGVTLLDMTPKSINKLINT